MLLSIMSGTSITHCDTNILMHIITDVYILFVVLTRLKNTTYSTRKDIKIAYKSHTFGEQVSLQSSEEQHPPLRVRIYKSDRNESARTLTQILLLYRSDKHKRFTCCITGCAQPLCWLRTCPVDLRALNTEIRWCLAYTEHRVTFQCMRSFANCKSAI